MEDKNNTSINQAGIIHNCLYMMSLAMDRLMREVEPIMNRHSESFVREKKKLFTRYLKTVKEACILQDEITQDTWDMEAKHDYRNVDFWLAQ